jgi:hypothetical protein
MSCDAKHYSHQSHASGQTNEMSIGMGGEYHETHYRLERGRAKRPIVKSLNNRSPCSSTRRRLLFQRCTDIGMPYQNLIICTCATVSRIRNAQPDCIVESRTVAQRCYRRLVRRDVGKHMKHKPHCKCVCRRPVNCLSSYPGSPTRRTTPPEIPLQKRSFFSSK